MWKTIAMETLKSDNKKRVLPSWMTAPGNERKVVSVKTAKRKQTAAIRVGAATRAPAKESRGHFLPLPPMKTQTLLPTSNPRRLSVWVGLIL